MQPSCIGAIFARFAVFGMYKWSTRILERSQEFDTVRVRRKHSPDTMNTHGANYYVPIENESCTKQHNDFDKPRCMPRILGRRFALTSTAYKYLDVGINVGPMSFVDILIGDNRGNQIVLPHATWTALIERRMDIEQLLESTIGSSLSIHDAVIELVKMRDASVVKLTSCNTSLYMKPSTMLFIFELGQCVKHEYFKLYQNTHEVNMKFNQFVTILRRKCIIDKCRVLKLLPGRDGIPRLAQLKLNSGELIRPIQRLYLLEADPVILEGDDLAPTAKPEETAEVIRSHRKKDAVEVITHKGDRKKETAEVIRDDRKKEST
ncbi:uncharacterized protein LOC112460140, partial [Temnothorax curvispinosus]|uniref:Uncharacterized protein LOC112460140 n=1 Tax=Temnothorax curvispinosus TaxID=300111 RepID=A0A6J1QDR6_9HYME